MADSIIRLRVDSQEYDNKLKRATQGLARYADECRKTGKSLDSADKETLEYVRALGQMETSSRTATGKLAEMRKAFVELSAQYKQMTDAEKATPFGKALSEGLDQLKPRIQEAKKQLEDINSSLNESGGEGGGLFGGGGFKGMLQVFGGNLMTKAAGLVANLGSEVVNVMNESAALAREAEGVQIAFARLGDGTLLDGLREATHGTVSDFELMKAAVKFNDFKLPLEELGTMLAFAQQKAKDTGQSVDYMVDSIVTGLGRKSLMILDNLGLSATEVKDKMKETGDMTKAVGEIIREQMSKAGDYVETASDRATQANVELENAMLELGNAMRETFGYDGWDTMAAGIKKELVGAITFTIETINEAKMRFMELLQLMGLADKPKPPTPKAKPADGTYYEQYDAAGNRLGAGRYINGKAVQTEAADFVVSGTLPGNNKSTRTGGGRGTVTDPSESIYNQFRKAMAKSELGADKLKPDDFIAVPSVWENYADGIKGTFDAIGDSMSNLTKWTDQIDPYKQKMEELANAAKQQRAAMNMAGQAVSNFGAALTSIDDPSAKAAGTVMQAIASIALGFATASANANTAGTGWGWLAWVAAGMAAMATAISTVHSLTGYAEGGMVSGNQYSGDNIPIMANAGEVVLNKAMQSNLAQQLESPRGGGGFTASHVSGEQIWIALNAYTKRSGQGEIVTWR